MNNIFTFTLRLFPDSFNQKLFTFYMWITGVRKGTYLLSPLFEVDDVRVAQVDTKFPFDFGWVDEKRFYFDTCIRFSKTNESYTKGYYPLKQILELKGKQKEFRSKYPDIKMELPVSLKQSITN